jgi:hypothetical protein
MTGEPYAGADPHTDVVYVAWGNRGLGVRVTPDHQVYEWFVSPVIDMVPLLGEDRDDEISEAVDEAVNEQRAGVLAGLAEIKVPRKIREALAAALDYDADEIGKQS